MVCLPRDRQSPYLINSPVANLPAEIAHLLEEIQAKDRVLQECRSVINTRDNSIQKWMKVNGTSQLNPKEEPYSRTILANFDKAQTIQEEKVGLSAKVGVLVSLSSLYVINTLLTVRPSLTDKSNVST